MSAARPERVRSLADRLLLLLGSTLVTLLVLETGFRVFDVRGFHMPREEPGKRNAFINEEAERVPGVRLQFRPYARFAHRYESNPRGAFDANNEVPYALNRYGFRGPDWERSKPSGTRRIVFLGDSFTFGAGVGFDDTFVARVQEIVNQRENGPIEVLGFAVGGWGTSDEISYLEHEGMRFDPDLVVLVYVLNDADYAGGLDLWEGFRQKYEARRFASSYLVSYLYAVLARRELARAYIDGLVKQSEVQRQSWRQSFEALARGRELVESAGGRFAIAVFPFLYALDESYPFRSLHEMIASFCAKNEIEMIDLFDVFEGRPYASLWVHASDQHPNEAGHAIAAEALADFILERGLLAEAVEGSGPGAPE